MKYEFCKWIIIYLINFIIKFFTHVIQFSIQTFIKLRNIWDESWD